ncbi:MAG: hypothetical protein Q9227_003856 [Pyrenula ochraceoflavens]
MGLLQLGTPLAWPDAKKAGDQVREWGIEVGHFINRFFKLILLCQQLLAIWKRAKGKERDALLWGDEIEYLVVCLDDEKRKARLSLRQADILNALAKDEELQKKGGCVPEQKAGEE